MVIKTTKVNIGIAISRNYDKVSLEILDEPIIHDTESEFTAKIRQKFEVLKGEVELQFTKLTK